MFGSFRSRIREKHGMGAMGACEAKSGRWWKEEDANDIMWMGLERRKEGRSAERAVNGLKKGKTYGEEKERELERKRSNVFQSIPPILSIDSSASFLPLTISPPIIRLSLSVSRRLFHSTKLSYSSQLLFPPTRPIHTHTTTEVVLFLLLITMKATPMQVLQTLLQPPLSQLQSTLDTLARLPPSPHYSPHPPVPHFISR